MRNSIVYFIHAVIVVSTMFILAEIDGIAWQWMLLVIAPLGLATWSKMTYVCYTLNVRLLLPVSCGIFTVALYHYFPELIASQPAQGLALYGVSNDEVSIAVADFTVSPLFRETVSVMYPICVAFLLWKGLTDFDELKQTLYEEIAQVMAISDYLQYFRTTSKTADGPESQEVRTMRSLLADYLENMLHGKSIKAIDANESVLKTLKFTSSQLECKDKNDPVALEEIMKGLTHISLLRSKRTFCIEKRMSPILLLLIFIMSVAMVAGFFGEPSSGVSIDYVYIFLLPTFYATIFVTLIDMSSPFDGYYSVKIDAIRTAQFRLSVLGDGGADQVRRPVVGLSSV